MSHTLELQCCHRRENQEIRRRARAPRPTEDPSDYLCWLNALVEHFGPDAVGRWEREPPGWTFDEWIRRPRRIAS